MTVETNSHKERAEKGGFRHAGLLKQQTMFDHGRRLRLLLQSCSITTLTEQVCRCNKRGDDSWQQHERQLWSDAILVFLLTYEPMTLTTASLFLQPGSASAWLWMPVLVFPRPTLAWQQGLANFLSSFWQSGLKNSIHRIWFSHSNPFCAITVRTYRFKILRQSH